MFKNYKDLSTAIHKDGIFIILLAAVATFLVSALFSYSIGWVFAFLTLWCMYFFRNPSRATPVIEDIVVSPADGIVTEVSYAKPPAEMQIQEEMLKIGIFLNVFNVHVNRVPVDGKIIKLHYNPGKFFNASLDKASIHNERQTILMTSNSGKNIVFAQIAGFVARRIVCDLEEDMEVKAGERFGIIRFGSRVDVYLPKDAMPLTCVGQTMIGGETIIANLSDKSGKKVNFEFR